MVDVFSLPNKLLKSKMSESSSTYLNKKIAIEWNNLTSVKDIDDYFETNPGIFIHGSSNAYKEEVATSFFKKVCNQFLQKYMGAEYEGHSPLCPFVTGYNLIDIIENKEKVSFKSPVSEETVSHSPMAYFQKMKVLYISRLCELPNYFGRDWKVIDNIIYNRYLNNNWTVITTDQHIDDLSSVATSKTFEIFNKYGNVDVA